MTEHEEIQIKSTVGYYWDCALVVARYINAVALGWVLCLIALGLNLWISNKYGAMYAIGALACAWVTEQTSPASWLRNAAVVTCAMLVMSSYAVWWVLS